MKARGKDNHGHVGTWSNYKTVTITSPQNQPPSATRPSGPSSGNVGQSLTYSSTVTDPDGDQVAVQFDWGDGHTSSWSSYHSSGSSISMSHSWSSAGTYHVKARGKDNHGHVGTWSNYITVNISGGGTGVQVTIPDTSAHAGDTVRIPVYVGNVTGLEIYSFQLNVCAPNFMTPLDVLPGALTSSWGIPMYNPNGSCVSVAMAGASPLSGSGELIWIKYLIDPNAQVGDNGEIRITSIQFNEGTPSAIPQNGSIVILPNVCVISGHVSYAISNLPVPGVTIEVNGDSTGTTDEQGSYSIEEEFGNVYTVRPKKKDDINNCISAYDASLILRYNVGRIGLTPLQKIAADVSGNGAISAFDASYILRFNVGRIDRFPVMEDSTHFWRFVPQSFPLDSSNWRTAPNNITYNPLQSDQTDQDYYAIIYGDVSHNWSSSGKAIKGKEIPEGEILLTDAEGSQGDMISIPVKIKGGSNIYSLNMNIVFDAEAFDFVSVRKGQMAKDFDLIYNVDNGIVKLAMAGINPIEGDGTIMNLTFRIKSGIKTGNVEQIKINNIQLNEYTYNKELIANVKIVDTSRFRLLINGSNPAVDNIVFKYEVPQECWVKIEVYNSTGQKLGTLVNRRVRIGEHSVKWESHELTGGVYFVVMRAGDFKIVKKFIIVRK